MIDNLNAKTFFQVIYSLFLKIGWCLNENIYSENLVIVKNLYFLWVGHKITDKSKNTKTEFVVYGFETSLVKCMQWLQSILSFDKTLVLIALLDGQGVCYSKLKFCLSKTNSEDRFQTVLPQNITSITSKISLLKHWLAFLMKNFVSQSNWRHVWDIPWESHLCIACSPTDSKVFVWFAFRQ